MKNKNLNHRKTRLITAAILLAVLSGCAGGKTQDNPIGIGSGPNKLKKSPCACMRLPNLGEPIGFDGANYIQTSGLS